MPLIRFLLRGGVIWKALVTLGIGATAALGQQVTIGLSSGSSAPGGTVTLNISISSSGGAQPAAVEWSMPYSFSDALATSVVAGPALTGINKGVLCTNNAFGAICVAAGMNATAIGNGVLATVTFQIASGTKKSSVPVSVSNVIGSTGAGNSIPGTGTGGTISLSQSTSGISVDVTQSHDNVWNSKVVASPAFSTASSNELLLAFVSTGFVYSSFYPSVTRVSGGGLTWVAVRATPMATVQGRRAVR